MNTHGRVATFILGCATILAGLALSPGVHAQAERAPTPARAVAPARPAPALQQVYALSIASILLNSTCQVKIQIRNTGAALTSDQHAESNVRMGGKSAVSLARLDPNGRLKTAGELAGFVDELPLTADTDYLVEVTLFNGKSVSQRSLLKPRCSGPARTERPAAAQEVDGHEPS
jgi:hypothetical protein